jgi:hypothetical protein
VGGDGSARARAGTVGDGDVTAADKYVLAIAVGPRRRRGGDDGVVVVPSATLLHYSHNNQ